MPSRLNGSSLENDAFSDKSEREVAEESDSETQDHSRKTNESGSDQSEVPGGPVPRGTTYVEQVQEELWEVRPCPVCDPSPSTSSPPAEAALAMPGVPQGYFTGPLLGPQEQDTGELAKSHESLGWGCGLGACGVQVRA